jgi:3',5'-cyclic AMP phosphodiesterase CpdA
MNRLGNKRALAKGNNMIEKKYGFRFFRALLFVVAILILSVAIPAGGRAQSTASLYFVQITDTHWGDRDNFKRTQKAVEQINALPMPIKCVIHTGDITMDKIEDESVVEKGLKILRELKVPVHFVPGNHDILRSRHSATQAAYTKYFGLLVTEAEYDGVIFLMIYTEPLAKSFIREEYSPLAELEAALKRADKKPVIVFHHSPDVDDFYNNAMHEGWKNEIREKWKSILNSYNVKAVIAGHFHRDEHYWLGEVPVYVSSSIAGYFGRQGTFRVYEYKEGKVGYRTQYLE